MAMIGVGDLVLAAIPATNLSIGAVAVPLLVIGAGFKLAVTSITVVAVNSVPTSKAGMASGATSMLRDGGLTLGPAIVGRDRADQRRQRDQRQGRLDPGAASRRWTAFYAAPEHVPAAQRADGRRARSRPSSPARSGRTACRPRCPGRAAS